MNDNKSSINERLNQEIKSPQAEPTSNNKGQSKT